MAIEDDIEDVISPYSLDRFLISNAPRMQKHIKNAKKPIDSRIVVSRGFNFFRKSKGEFLFAKNIWIYRRIERNHRINDLIEINS